jgi:hypothetical protein
LELVLALAGTSSFLTTKCMRVHESGFDQEEMLAVQTADI